MHDDAGVYVDEDDIAAYTIKTVDDPRALNKTIYIRPPKNALSQRQVVELWEKHIGKQLHKTSTSAQEFLDIIKGNTTEITPFPCLTSCKNHYIKRYMWDIICDGLIYINVTL